MKALIKSTSRAVRKEKKYENTKKETYTRKIRNNKTKRQKWKNVIKKDEILAAVKIFNLSYS